MEALLATLTLLKRLMPLRKEVKIEFYVLQLYNKSVEVSVSQRP